MMKRHVVQTRASVLSEKRQVRVICSTETKGRDDIILVTRGIDLTNFRLNPVVMWQHCPDWPIARAVEIGVEGNDLVATVQFPEAGASPRADEVYNLVKAGVINAVSTGFEMREAEPLDPSKPRDGLRITACELQEFSFVSIPAVPDALVTERSAKAHRGRNAGKLRRKRLAALYQAETEAAATAPKPNKHRRMAALYAAELVRKP